MQPKKVGQIFQKIMTAISNYNSKRKTMELRLIVLKHTEELAKYYTHNSNVDPRAMPIVVPVARLISIVDAYLNGGVEGIAKNQYADVMRSIEEAKMRINAVNSSIESLQEWDQSVKEYSNDES